jgi:hypothetical protein
VPTRNFKGLRFMTVAPFFISATILLPLSPKTAFSSRQAAAWLVDRFTRLIGKSKAKFIWGQANFHYLVRSAPGAQGQFGDLMPWFRRGGEPSFIEGALNMNLLAFPNHIVGLGCPRPPVAPRYSTKPNITRRAGR